MNDVADAAVSKCCFVGDADFIFSFLRAISHMRALSRFSIPDDVGYLR
jgi:hypothetical protein